MLLDRPARATGTLALLLSLVAAGACARQHATRAPVRATQRPAPGADAGDTVGDTSMDALADACFRAREGDPLGDALVPVHDAMATAYTSLRRSRSGDAAVQFERARRLLASKPCANEATFESGLGNLFCFCFFDKFFVIKWQTLLRALTGKNCVQKNRAT